MNFIRQVGNVFLLLMVAFALSITFPSCVSKKNITYMNDLPDSTHIFLPPINKGERKIEYADQLSIMITAEEREAVAYFNSAAVISTGPVGSTSGGSTGAATPPAGYLVDPLGYIEFPIIGKIKVLGMTERQLKESLTKTISKYVKDPLVDVRFTSFRITVIGEVGSPGTYILDMQRTTIFQALAAAGDLPTNAKRYDVALYRDYNGERQIIKFDLRKKDFLYDQEVFEMRHNDVLYVQPLRNQLFREDFGFFTSLLGLAAALISLAVVLFNNN